MISQSFRKCFAAADPPIQYSLARFFVKRLGQIPRLKELSVWVPATIDSKRYGREPLFLPIASFSIILSTVRHEQLILYW